MVFGKDGIAGAANADKILVDHSTAMPLPTAEMAKRLAGQTGMRWVDAPLSGGPGFAREGKLTVMAGGEQAAFDAVLPVMRDYAQNMTLMGPAGAGQMTKVINQGICGVTYVLMAEVLRLAEEGGIDAARISDCLTGGHADSTLLHFAYPKMQTATSSRRRASPGKCSKTSTMSAKRRLAFARFAAGSHCRAALSETCRCGQRHARDLLDLRTLPSAEGVSAMRIERQSLHLEILRRVRDMIVEGKWPPGVRIPEMEVCAELGISRTPLREALKVLAFEGLVDLLQSRGALVKRVSPQEARDMLELMGELEAFAGRRRARKRPMASLPPSPTCTGRCSIITQPHGGATIFAPTKPFTTPSSRRLAVRRSRRCTRR